MSGCIYHALGWHLADMSDFSLTLIVDGAPAVLKNGKRIVRFGNRPSLIASDRARSYLASATAQLRDQWSSVFRARLPITVMVNARITSYLATRRKVDLSNSYQAVEDALQHALVLENDWQIGGHDGSRRRYDPERPRVEIVLTPLREVDQHAHACAPSQIEAAVMG